MLHSRLVILTKNVRESLIQDVAIVTKNKKKKKLPKLHENILKYYKLTLFKENIFGFNNGLHVLGIFYKLLSRYFCLN